MQAALRLHVHDWRSSFGDAMWLAFVSAQAADGVLTYVGMTVFGVSVEGNPIIAWYAAAIGAKGALLGAKLLSVVCAAVLHAKARHFSIGVLTIVCLRTAVWPWIELLWP